MKLINNDDLLFQFLLWSVKDGSGALQKALVVQSLRPNAEDAGDARHAVWSLGCEDPLEDGMATLSSILAWRIPWTEEPCRLQSTGSQTQLKQLSTHTRMKVRWIQLKESRQTVAAVAGNCEPLVCLIWAPPQETGVTPAAEGENQVVSFYSKCGLSQRGDSHQQRHRSREERPRETHVGNTKGTWEAGYLPPRFPRLWKMTPILNLSRNLVTYFFQIIGLSLFIFFISWSIYYYESLLKYSWLTILHSFQV